ncbi:hypothetical protein P8452_65082 [Trifolium repens]|nr:hypothetical protein P8452_65082 [Trifolium repens]
MGDLSDATNVFSSPTAGQNMTTMGTPKTRKNRPAVWNDFTLDPESEKIVICDHCGSRKSSIIESLIIEDYKELEKLEQEIAAMKVGDACSASVSLDED